MSPLIQHYVCPIDCGDEKSQDIQSVSRSKLANFLAVPTDPGPNAQKTGSARVLTSSEHIRMLEERERKKREEAQKKNREDNRDW